MSIVAQSRAPVAPTGWLTIREASSLIGVSVATLRRWCDAGEVRAFTTPGGHRRFERAAVLGLAAGSDRRANVGCGGETQIRIVRAYRRELRRPGGPVGTVAGLNERTRDLLRYHGEQMVGALIDLLDAPPGNATRHLDRARASAAACGTLAAEADMSLGDTIALFARFRGPFVHQLGAVVRGQGRDAAGATAVLEAASDALDRLLPALVSGYEAARL